MSWKKYYYYYCELSTLSDSVISHDVIGKTKKEAGVEAMPQLAENPKSYWNVRTLLLKKTIYVMEE